MVLAEAGPQGAGGRPPAAAVCSACDGLNLLLAKNTDGGTSERPFHIDQKELVTFAL